MDRDTADCLTEADALQLVSGEGAAEEVERWRSHVGECETCRRFVAELARICVPTESSEGLGGAPAVLPSGTALGHYDLQEVLGRGGMGVVYGAFDRRLSRSVALKVLRSRTDAFARLRREASVMARLSHPNVAEVYDVGEADGRPYVVLERVEGPTLLEWRMSASRSVEDVLGVYAQAGRGLAAAHRAGLVHRDFKPTNAMLGEDGRVRVLDFGLAASAEDGSEPSRDSGATHRALAGTPSYAAPEQLDGREATAASDQFSFCVALFEALADRKPFPGDTAAARRASMEREDRVPLPPEIPRGISRALARGLQLDPRRRFASMDALLAALTSPPSRWPWLVGAAAAATTVAFVLVPERATPCDDGRTRIEQAWSPDDAGLRTTPALRRSVEELDAYVDAWLSSRATACTRAQGAPPELACFERLAAKVARVGRRLETLRNDGGRPPADLVEGLPMPSTCLAPSTMSGADRLLEEEFEQLDAWLRDRDAYGLEGPAARVEARRRVGTLLARADRLGALRIQAATLRSLAALDIFDSDPDAAARTLEEAALLGHLAEDRDVELRAIEDLVAVLSKHLDEPDQAAYWLCRAEEVAAVLDSDVARGRVSILAGRVALAKGEWAEASASFEDAEERLPGSWRLKSLLQMRGEAYMQADDTEAARADWQRGLALAEAEFGPNSIELAPFLSALASTYMEEGELEPAAAFLERAIAVTPPDRGIWRAFLSANLGLLQRDLGRLEDAELALTDAEAVFADVYGESHTTTLRTTVDLAFVQLSRGRRAQAHRRFTLALGFDAPEVLHARTRVGRAAAADEPARALEALLREDDLTETARDEAQARLEALR
ncbi:MAG: protein kinase [Myxococcota bacterium]